VAPQLPEPARLPYWTRHPAVARAAVGPAAIVSVAGGVAIGVAVQSVVLAVVLGVGAWLGRMAYAVRRSSRQSAARPPAIDPYAVPDPWRQYVRQAGAAGQRFDQAAGQWPEGPLRDRLLMLQPQVEDAVNEVWSVARRGAALTGSPATGVSRRQLSAELQKVQAERLRLDPTASQRAEVLAGREAAIAAQIRAARHAEDAAGQAADRLRLMTAQLDEAVTQLLELGLRHEDPSHQVFDTVAPSIGELVDQIRALEDGLRSVETLGAAPSLGAGPISTAGAVSTDDVATDPSKPSGSPPTAGPASAPSPPTAS
jgi:hypothetical protein